VQYTLEIFVKLGKDSTSTLSLVIHGAIQKNPAKKYISIQPGGGGGGRKPSIILMVPEFHPLFLLFLSGSTAVT